MLRGEDVIVLLDLCDRDATRTVRAIAERTSLPIANIHRSLKRLEEARLIADDRTPLRANAAEFLRHALRYLAPVAPGRATRGTPTAWAAPPLNAELSSDDPLPPVWPDLAGTVRGAAVAPLHPYVPRAARANPELGEQLALVDAIRMGDARTRTLATTRLLERVGLTA